MRLIGIVRLCAAPALLFVREKRAMARTISDTATEICSLRHGIENAAWEEARGKLMVYLRLRGSCVGGDQEEYAALKDEIEKFIERIDEDDIYSQSHDEITRLREENARLRAALEFYADSKNYSEIETGIGMLDGMSERDCCGRRAREALGMEE